MPNPYVPMPVRLVSARPEADEDGARSLRLEFLKPWDARRFSHLPGQFVEASLAGLGEIPLAIASSPLEDGPLLVTVQDAGPVGQALQDLKPGELLGLRGPLGQGFPFERHQGRDLVFVAAGQGVTAVRSAIMWLCHPGNRSRFGRITLLYGAARPGQLLFRDDWAALASRADELDLRIYLGVDHKSPKWDGLVGFLPALLEAIAPHTERSLAYVCGPSAMAKFVQAVFDKLSWPSSQVFVALENRMKCGVGTCGHCNVGPYYVCKDGPVFSKEILDKLPKEY